MGSVSRRLAKHLSYYDHSVAKQIKGRRAGMSVSAAAALIAPAMTEGVLLSERLERAAKENNAQDPLHFLDYLRKMRRGYDRQHDGPSKLMDLVDEINKFELEETARRKAAVDAKQAELS